MSDAPYRGRFAPSPTGPLHFGSLIAATASYLQARNQGGEWWLRIEDIDPPREIAGAGDAILRTLEAFGFEWDGPVTYQSQRTRYYEDALAQLRQAGLAYPCACSRKDIALANAAGIYPGTCRRGLAPHQSPRAWRLRVPEELIEFVDKIQGPQRCAPTTEIGDFVLFRADGYYAYQLATGFDDAEQGMTEVVRGADLLDSTPRQRLIQSLLGMPNPTYAHHPVAVNAEGEKLSKQTFAPALNHVQATALLYAALRFLGQPVPPELQNSELRELWAWARENWKMALIPQIRQELIEKFP